MSKSQVKRWVVGADKHFPKLSWSTWNAMCQVIEDIQPYGYIAQGDQFDNEEISHHNSRKPYYKVKGSYRKNTEQFDERILTPLDAYKFKEKVWIIGNHDDWEFQMVEAHPEMEGQIDRVRELGLVKRGWNVIPLGHAFELGELNVIHGEVLTGIGNQAGMYPSRKAVELYGGNVLAAHTHAAQSFTKISPVNQKRKHMGWISPILGACNPTYLKNRPTAWLNGFNVVEQHPNGYFNLYPVIVSEGVCSYGGKLYGGKN